MNWKVTDPNGLCVSILLNNTRWYLGVIVKLHNNECLIYIFTSNFQNCTPSIFNKSLYNCWYKELKNRFPLVMIYTKYNNVYFLNQGNGKLPGVF